VAPEPEGSSLHSHEGATGPYPEPTKSTLHTQPFSPKSILIPSCYLCLDPQSGLFRSVFPTKPLHTFPPLQCVPHAPPISFSSTWGSQTVGRLPPSGEALLFLWGGGVTSCLYEGHIYLERNTSATYNIYFGRYIVWFKYFIYHLVLVPVLTLNSKFSCRLKLENYVIHWLNIMSNLFI
jgi:hypothetical protein